MLITHKVTSSDCFFCPTNSPKPKNFAFTFIKSKGKQLLRTGTSECLPFMLEKWLKLTVSNTFSSN